MPSWKKFLTSGGGGGAKADYAWHGLPMMRVLANTEAQFKLLLDTESANGFRKATGWDEEMQVWSHKIQKPGAKYPDVYSCSRGKYFCPYCYLNEKATGDKPFPVSSRVLAPVVRREDNKAGYMFFNYNMLQAMDAIVGEGYTGHIKVKVHKQGNGFPQYTLIMSAPFSFKATKEDKEMWAYSKFEQAWADSMVVAQNVLGDTVSGETISDWYDIARDDATVDIQRWGGLIPSVDGDTTPRARPKVVPPASARKIQSKPVRTKRTPQPVQPPPDDPNNDDGWDTDDEHVAADVDF